MALLITLAWIGAIGWPLIALLAAWAWPGHRRSWLARACAVAVTLAWAPLVWAFLIEPQLLVVREVRVESEAWRGPPVRIGLISDIHIGHPRMGPERVGQIVRRLNALEPDIVLLAGDYIAGHTRPWERAAETNLAIEQGLAALGALEAPLGTVAVLGNHDWWYEGTLVERALTEAGVRVLENAALEVETGGARFWVAGLADYESEVAQPDWGEGLAPVPEAADVVALAHWPDVFWAAPQRVALTVAGHSHCGQVVLPILGGYPISPGSAKWPCGLYDEDGRKLYVTGGLGVSGLPMRFGAPPEIVVVMLSGTGDDARAVP